MKEKIVKEVEADNDKDNTQIYELGYHVLPSVAEEDLSKEVAQIHSLISEFGGTIISEGLPLMQQLAYEITKRIEIKNVKFTKAYFGWVKFEIDREKVVGLESKIKMLQNILRFILIKTVRENTMYTPKVPVVKKESSKEDAIDDIVTESVEKMPVSEEEIDKSIDELVDQAL